TSGIVTLEDVLEEIVGEILDETDVEKIEIKKISKDEYLLDGSADIDELNKRFGLEIDDSFDSFSGFLYHLFEGIPEQNETKIFKEKFQFFIEKLDGQRISSVKMKILGNNVEA
ncbi:MAG: transporter associated domain-containing protein, partial [Candidatus Cloacimonadota bacterium]|nr:transporter associated domain-containing protein [Candidatus Cloacimonadota bacterium]